MVYFLIWSGYRCVGDGVIDKEFEILINWGYFYCFGFFLVLFFVCRKDIFWGFLFVKEFLLGRVMCGVNSLLLW